MSDTTRDEQFERELRRFLAWQADDTVGAPSATELAARIAGRRRAAGPGSVLALPAYQRPVLIAVLLALLLALLLGGAVFFGSPLLPDLTIVENDPIAQNTPLPATTQSTIENGWIVFSTQPGGRQSGATDSRSGGDIYIGREGVAPTVIVSRGPASISNVCPTFSPDGSKIVYGEGAALQRAVVVLDIAADGSVAPNTRLNVAGSGAAPCPRWSTDGRRLAYMLDGALVVKNLDGSSTEPRAGDPVAAELVLQGEDPGIVTSPSGQLTAELTASGAVFAAADGSFQRVVRFDDFRWMARSGYPPETPYGLAGWSPDSTKVLLMYDVSGRHFTMRTLSVEEPFASEVVAGFIPVNGARSWPAFGDVSWQPVFK